ncbi:MAG: DUF1549 domain-containing protein, partial [Planctomycetes bacterium]|nr:DUF1549 domain-containing protein [Planctomycetota bacterium]
MNTNRIGKKWWLLTAAGLTLACFVLTLSHDGAAQTTKKADPKAKTKDKDKAKEDTTESPKKEKAEPPPSTFPARRDIVEGSKLAPLVAMIDEHITKGWKGNSTYPSERCTDHEFIRRASIDIIGRIPTPKEVDAFMKHGESTRRSWLVNAMLDGKEYDNGREYAQNFANLWTVNLMTRSGSGKHYQAQMNDWLYDQFKGDEKNAPDWSRSARALIAVQGDTNKGDGRAANYLLHNLGEAQNANVRDKNGKFDMVPATSRTTRLFLGIRTQCVQCHDHPFNGEWRQDHFWGINTFLRQIDTKGTQGNARPVMFAAKKKQKGVVGTEEFTLSDNKSFNANGLISFERRNGIVFFTDAFMLDPLKKVPKKAESPRREILAGYVTSSPWFAKAFVNRTWGHFFGTSFTKGPVDDFHEQNPVSHPELLDKLAEM